MCVRQMCRQTCHVWMLCMLGHTCLSSSGGPMEITEGDSKERNPFPAQEVQVEQNLTQPGVIGMPWGKARWQSTRTGVMRFYSSSHFLHQV